MDLFLVLLSLLAIGSAKIPKGYILDVTPTCTSNKADATVVITSDLNVKAVFHCSGQSYTETIDEKKTKVTFKIHYSDKKDKKCFFKNPSATSNVFIVTLELFWGEPGASAKYQIRTQKKIYKIVCTTGGRKSVASKTSTIGERPFAPEQKVQHKGPKSAAGMSLELYDALGKSLTAKKVDIGKKVFLKGESTGARAIVPVDCVAISDKKEKYQILRGGCGDGIVFKTNKGFTTKRKTTRSPIFNFFNFPTGSKISFKCTFIECTTATCSLKKDSCVSRKRRSIEDLRSLDVFKPDQKAISKIIKMSTDYTTGHNEDSNTFPGKILIVYSSPPAAEPRLKETEDREYTMMMFAILSCFTAVSLVVSLYMYTKQGRYRSEL